jgi:adenine-specific DNA-methyltransferase
VEKQGGWYEVQPDGLEAFPIPPANPEQQGWCGWLAEALTLMHSQAKKTARDESSGLMIAFFEQWLNGLVYELFFPDELRARKLKLFDETARMNPPDLAKVPESRKPEMLQEVFARAYDSNAALRGMLFDLRSLEVVRVIEDVFGSKGKTSLEDEA